MMLKLVANANSLSFLQHLKPSTLSSFEQSVFLFPLRENFAAPRGNNFFVIKKQYRD